jgi:hypothetical protein
VINLQRSTVGKLQWLRSNELRVVVVGGEGQRDIHIHRLHFCPRSSSSFSIIHESAPIVAAFINCIKLQPHSFNPNIRLYVAGDKIGVSIEKSDLEDAFGKFGKLGEKRAC